MMDYDESEMMEDMALEDMAMGKKPKMKPGKPSARIAKEVKGTMEIIAGLESRSIADYKKFSPADRKALKHALSELAEACYTAKNLIREATPKEEKRGGMSIMVGEEY